jgi:hypothetical protein
VPHLRTVFPVLSALLSGCSATSAVETRLASALPDASPPGASSRSQLPSPLASPTPASDAVEPTFGALPWPAPPSSIGCVVEVDDLAEPVTVLGEDDLPIAALLPGSLDAVWGIPKGFGPSKDATSTQRGAWVHAQSRGVSATGHVAPGALRLTIAREVEVVAGHAWILAGSVTAPTSTLVDGRVAVAPVSDVKGTEQLRGYVSCAALSERFEPPEPDEPTSAVEAPEEVFHAVGPLALRRHPGGGVFTTLELHGDLPVKQRQGEFVRVRFRTDTMRFDAWVKSDPGPPSSFWGSSGFCRLEGRAARPPTRWVIGQTTGARVGNLAPGSADVGVTFAEGTPVRVVHRVGDFWAVRPHDSRIRAPEQDDYWVPASSVHYRASDPSPARR